MSHTLGRFHTDGRQVGPVAGSNITTLFPADVPAGVDGNPRFVILHFVDVNLPGTDRLVVGIDEFGTTDGDELWTRPIDPDAGPITITYVGSNPAGVATLAEYGSGEPVTTGTPPGSRESRTNPDLFLHTNPYDPPVFETRGRSGLTFDWLDADSVTDPTDRLAVDATCILVTAHPRGGSNVVSSCSGTLIDTDLVITSNHCFNGPDDIEARSGSVTFDYMTDPSGSKPAGYAPIFYKITDVVRRHAGQDWVILRIDLPPGGTGITPRPMREWSLSAGESVHAVHHPNGAVKKWQAGVASNASSISGLDLAGGSSGGGVFDTEARLVIAAMQSQYGAGPSSRDVLDALANPDPPPNPVDVVLVMDRSGSMAGPSTPAAVSTKLEDAQEAAELFVELLQTAAGHRVGLVSFSTVAAPPSSTLEAVDAMKKQELRGDGATPGVIDNLTANGMTGIGNGLQAALAQLGDGGVNDSVILLMTDGLENRSPMIAEVEMSGTLGDTRLCIIGFGREESLDGPLLADFARLHEGFYTRAADGLDLRKLFALCFGDIFLEGALDDPRGHIEAETTEVKATDFVVCGEDSITVVLGWENRRGDLDFVLTTPSGVEITSESADVESSSGRTWFFMRVPLPFGADRDGTWQMQVRRRPSANEFPDRSALDYFTMVIAEGGPQLTPERMPRRLYTGDVLSPRVLLRNRDGTRPGAEVVLHIERLDGSLGALVSEAGLAQPPNGADPVDTFTASLQAVAAASGGRLPISTTSITVGMDDEPDGVLAPNGRFGADLSDVTRFEGNYQLRAVARFDSASCQGQREATWSLHVELGIDPDQSTIDDAGGGFIRLTPRDVYGNPLGPGRGDRFELDGVPGTTVTGPPADNGDGSYDIPAEWDPAGLPPGVVVHQPDRDGVVIVPPGSLPTRPGCPQWLCLLLVVLLVIMVILLLITL